MKRYKPNNSSENTFEYWSDLASNNPQEFEEIRKEAIRNCINNLSDDKRIAFERFQWRIEQVIRKSKTPLGACIAISKMMSEKIYGEDGLLSAMESLASFSEKYDSMEHNEGAQTSLDNTESNIIPFVKR